jgi:hypothetical protein
VTSDRVESAIDEAAGELTAGAPDAGFTAQVMRRIESGDAVRSWRAAWTIVPLAAAAIVMIAMFVARGPRPRDRDPQTAAGQQTPPAVARNSPPGDRGPKRAAPRETRTLPPSPQRGFGSTGPPQRGFGATGPPQRGFGVTGPPQRGFGVTATGNPDASDIPRLEMPRLAVDLLTQPPIPTDPIDVISPLTVAPLEIDEVQRRQE